MYSKYSGPNNFPVKKAYKQFLFGKISEKSWIIILKLPDSKFKKNFWIRILKKLDKIIVETWEKL